MADVREERLRKRFDDCFVDLSFPQAPVTFFIILLFLESPAPTFGLVKATRLTADLGYDSRTGIMTEILGRKGGFVRLSIKITYAIIVASKRREMIAKGLFSKRKMASSSFS